MAFFFFFLSFERPTDEIGKIKCQSDRTRSEIRPKNETNASEGAVFVYRGNPVCRAGVAIKSSPNALPERYRKRVTVSTLVRRVKSAERVRVLNAISSTCLRARATCLENECAVRARKVAERRFSQQIEFAGLARRPGGRTRQTAASRRRYASLTYSRKQKHRHVLQEMSPGIARRTLCSFLFFFSLYYSAVNFVIILVFFIGGQ